MSDKVELEPYSERWPLLFQEEKPVLLAALGNLACHIEHIGSTAVFGLPARPIIDILVATKTALEPERFLPALSPLGYNLAALSQPSVLCFAKGSPQTSKLYFVEEQSKEHKQLLAFRDHLAGNVRACAEYANLKQTMATKFADDPKAYEDSKTAFFYLVMCYVEASK